MFAIATDSAGNKGTKGPIERDRYTGSTLVFRKLHGDQGNSDPPT